MSEDNRVCEYTDWVIEKYHDSNWISLHRGGLLDFIITTSFEKQFLEPGDYGTPEFWIDYYKKTLKDKFDPKNYRVVYKTYRRTKELLNTSIREVNEDGSITANVFAPVYTGNVG